MPKLKALLISDTHGTHWNEGYQVDGDYDVLIHAGDFTNYGEKQEIESFMSWLDTQDQFKDIIYIAGNHDLNYQANPLVTLANGTRLHYLCDSSILVGGVKFYGSPHTPRFYDWSFMYEPEDADKIWTLIPDDTDVLITHGPPFGVFDQCAGMGGVMEHAGCPTLLDAVERIKSIKLHVFGHIHEGYGMQDHSSGRVSVNAAVICDEQRRVPVKFDIDTGE